MKSSVLTLGCILAGFRLAVAADGGRLHCENRVYDYGSITNAPGAAITNVYALRNIGTDSLHITRVRACCGASYVLESDTLPPRAESSLTVVVSLKGRVGKQRKAFYVHSSDPVQPILQLLMTGTILPSSGNPDHSSFDK